MADGNSLGPLGPNIISVEAITDTVYSVEGDNFMQGFRAVVQNGTGQDVQGVRLSDVKPTAFTITLPNVLTGPYSLMVVNPDGRTSTVRFATPGTDASNEALRADS